MSEIMDVDDDFTNRSAAFMRWLKSSGATISPKVELADLRQQNAGRGVVANEAIEADEDLFSIPRNVLLNAQNSDVSSNHPDLLSGVESEPWLQLNLTMLYENGKSDSRWRPYFDVLPKDGEFDTLMYWDEAELKELEASAVVNKIGKESADEMFTEKIWPIIQSRPQVFGFDSTVSEHEVLAAAHRMGSLIMAYAFDIESEREKEIDEEGYVSDEEDEDMPKAMVPLADMLNADAERNNARLFYEKEALVMRAVKPIAKDEEIFNDYGPLPRADLLRRYGYVTDEYAKYDVVEISSSLIQEVATDELKLKEDDFDDRMSHMELVEDLLEDGYDISRPNSEMEHPLEILPTSLKTYIAILAMSPSELPPSNKASKFQKFVEGYDFPLQWHTFLLALLNRRLAGYPSSLEEDKKHLEVYKQRLSSGMRLTNQQEMRRKIMAMSVRIGEKDILHHAIEVVEGFVKEKAEKQSQNGSPKKRKASSRPESGASTPKKGRR